MSRLKKNVHLTEREVQFLDLIDHLGPSTSEKVHETIEPKPDYLVVMRTLHTLAEKGFLQRILINKKQLYKTSRHYSYVKSFLNG